MALGHNPKDSWNYRDETFAGCMQKLSFRRGGKFEPGMAAEKLLLRWMADTPFLQVCQPSSSSRSLWRLLEPVKGYRIAVHTRACDRLHRLAVHSYMLQKKAYVLGRVAWPHTFKYISCFHGYFHLFCTKIMEPRSLKFCLLEKKLEDQIFVFWTCDFLRFFQKPKNLSGRLSGKLLFFQ